MSKIPLSGGFPPALFDWPFNSSWWLIKKVGEPWPFVNNLLTILTAGLMIYEKVRRSFTKGHEFSHHIISHQASTCKCLYIYTCQLDNLQAGNPNTWFQVVLGGIRAFYLDSEIRAWQKREEGWHATKVLNGDYWS